MIKTEHDAVAGHYRIVLTANASMTQAQSRVFLAAALAFLLGTGVAFAMLGAWPVLPFAGLEWLLLAYGMKKTLDQTGIQEVLTLSDGSLLWERGRIKPEVSTRFPCAWLVLEWSRPDNRNHPRRLFLRSHGHKLEVGSFLTDDEREILALTLGQLLTDHQK
ncbi:MAG: DUF2244 domain-containing protein [Methylococcaceae bacterium]